MKLQRIKNNSEMVCNVCGGPHETGEGCSDVPSGYMRPQDVPEMENVECHVCSMHLLVEKGTGLPKEHVCRFR